VLPSELLSAEAVIHEKYYTPIILLVLVHYLGKKHLLFEFKRKKLIPESMVPAFFRKGLWK
jgi:hypothetical protein